MKVRKFNFRKYYKDNSSCPAHWIHPYTAKLIPQIPRYFIEKYTSKNDIVLDPFCGSGTTLLEARLLGRNAVGIDINPLAVLISEVKVTPLDTDEVNSAIWSVKENIKNGNKKINVNFPNIDYWFSKDAQKELTKIRFSIDALNRKFNENIYKFLLVSFSSIIRKSSYADPRMAKTYKSKRIVEKVKAGWVSTPVQYFEDALDKNFEKIKSFSECINGGNNYAQIFQGDAREASNILRKHGVKKVDFIVTSPPYINAQDYFRSYKLELWWLGLASPEEVKLLDRKAIGTENLSGTNYNAIPKSEYVLLNTILHKIWKIDKKKSNIVYNYFENMKTVIKELYDVLKTNGYFCLITGVNTICGMQIPTHKIITHIAEANGFKLVEKGKDTIKNRALPPNRNHNGGIIKEEWITVFQKETSSK